MPVSLKKATKEWLKEHNTWLVLNELGKRDASRAELSRITGLTRATVSSLVADLIDAGLVLESETTRRTSSGRPPTICRINPDARTVVALDLGRRRLKGALVNLKGEITQSSEVEVRESASSVDRLEGLYSLVRDLLRAATSPVLGIGCGSPGLVDPRDGFVRVALTQGWGQLPLGKLIQEQFSIPTWVINDHHAAALGEFVFGDERSSDNLVVIRYVAGIGLGIVLDGQLHYGDGFSSGEIGHIVVDPGGALCQCGNHGCLERLAGFDAVVQELRSLADAAGKGPLAQAKGLSDHELMSMAMECMAHGDRSVRAIFDRVATYLGIALASIQGILNVRRVVLSGDLPIFDHQFIDVMMEEMRKRVLLELAEKIEPTPSKLGDEIVTLGAAAQVMIQELGLYAKPTMGAS